MDPIAARFYNHGSRRRDKLLSKETETKAAFERSAAIFMESVSPISLLAVTGWLVNFGEWVFPF
jgi:hypothetical protein